KVFLDGLVYDSCIFLDSVFNKNPNLLNQSKSPTLTPANYEKYIATQLIKLGFVALTTKSTGDQGADVLATKNGVSFAIQCKMYSKPVGNKAVQEANAGRDFYKKDYGVVVSNAGFTKSARQAANACGIILLNDNQLEDLLKYTNS
ncbi:MAG: restriction endonuclease, partial [Alphaproteobacteria bacterium]